MRLRFFLFRFRFVALSFGEVVVGAGVVCSAAGEYVVVGVGRFWGWVESGVGLVVVGVGATDSQ